MTTKEIPEWLRRDVLAEELLADSALKDMLKAYDILFSLTDNKVTMAGISINGVLAAVNRELDTRLSQLAAKEDLIKLLLEHFKQESKK